MSSMRAAECGHVLLVAYSYPPDNIVGAQRPFRFARYLPDFGFRVSVLTASSQPEGTPENVYWVADRRRTLWVRVIRRFLLEGEEGLPWIWPAFRKGVEIIQNQKITAIFSTCPPPAAHAAALLLKRKLGVRWVADFRDPMVGNPMRQAKLMPHADRFIERQVFEHADALIANTDAVEALWERRFPQRRAKITTIWNGFDPAEPVQLLPIPPRDHRVLLHPGVIAIGRYPGILLTAVNRLAGRGVIGPHQVRIRQLGLVDERAMGDPQVTRELAGRGMLEILPPVSEKEAKRQQAEADYLLLLDTVGPSAGLQLASKVFFYVRLGRPILAVTTRNSPADRLLARAGVPYVCLYESDPPEEVDRKVLEFLKLPTDPVPASEWFRKEFDAVRQTEKLAAVLSGP